jgi:hypothetical protein
MKNLGRILAPMLAAGLFVTIPGCREDAESPTAPESTATPSTTALSLAPNTWSARAPLPGHRVGFALGAAPNSSGQWIAYVFGGDDGDGTGLTGLAYNVATNTWFGAPSSLVHAENLNGVGKIGNKLFFTGGESCCDVDFRTWNTTWAYQPSTAQLFQKANMPRATKYGVTGVINGKLYVLPGWCSGEAVDPGHCTVGGPIRQLYRYDPSTNTWVARRQAPHFHTFGAAGVINGKFYVVGGQGQGRYLDVYDPTTNTWQTRASIPRGGEFYFGAALGNRLFVLLWFVNRLGTPEVKAYSYDPASNTWSTRAAPPKPVGAPIVRVVLNGQPRLFLAGSESSYLYTP